MVLSNSYLVEAILKSPFFASSTQNLNENKVAFVINTEDNNLLDFYSKFEISTIKYLCNVLKSSPSKPVRKDIVRKYIDDLRQDGPKIYVFNTNEYIPLIQPMGETSCVSDFLSTVLLKSISNFIDIPIIFHDLFSCSQCRVENIVVIEQHQLLSLLATNCEGLLLPSVALERYFLDESNKNQKTCNACGRSSDHNHFRKEIVQLPDVLYLSFSANRSTKDASQHPKLTEFFIQNHLDMSTLASSQMVCFPSYFKYQLKSVIINTENNKGTRHFYTFAKYGEDFYRCDDLLIEPVDKSLIFERKYATSIAMYVREKNNHVNFAETIAQILSETETFQLRGSFDNTHVRMMFDAALEFIARDTKVLSWSYGAVYKCLQCKETTRIFGADCVLFLNEKHLSKNAEISLDDTLIQAKLVPKIRCNNQCEGYTFIETLAQIFPDDVGGGSNTNSILISANV
ncbi:unnamed protein product [Rotaria sordida]|uniref:Uncharacterized protein n=1 Tax=Rotaria sordida TaxID=392033 RepID=A0A815PY70_9BILA|nr:unnamed protein product [Rotaria sordida]CAF1169720.1 unnamed protein product [Rotaria sordida]CAF1456082.1 unnamed protein product [Rotaria sordida]CAF3677045.1 unnamed protein product [Rotaria sordida]CAF4010229.1 unnamed protein product [Rotaria sordida]